MLALSSHVPRAMIKQFVVEQITKWPGLRRPVTFCFRKHEADADLRHTLVAFTNVDGDPGSRAQLRLKAYRQSQTFVRDHKRSMNQSGIGARGLRVIFYARYFASRDLLITGGASIPQHWAVDLDGKRPNKEFKDIIDQELLTCLKLSEEDVVKRDSYKEILSKYLNHDMAKQFLQDEKAIFNSISDDPRSSLADRFNALNRETLPFVQTNLNKDIRCLTKADVRMGQAVGGPYAWLKWLLGVMSFVQIVQSVRATATLKETLSDAVTTPLTNSLSKDVSQPILSGIKKLQESFDNSQLTRSS